MFSGVPFLAVVFSLFLSIPVNLCNSLDFSRKNSSLSFDCTEQAPTDTHHLKVPYYEKHVFSSLYIYKLVLPEPANSQNEESKRVLHGLCSLLTDKTALLQAVQILLLLLGVTYIGFPFSAWW